METSDIREEARKLVDSLAPGSTWEDLIHQIYVREAIEAGMADSEAGRTADVATVRAQYGLPK